MNNCFWKFSYLIKNLKLQAIKETSSLVHQLPPCPHATSHRTHITVWSAVVTSAKLVAVARFVFGLFVASVFFCFTFTQCVLPTWQNWKNSPHFTNTLTRHSHGWCLYNTHTHTHTRYTYYTLAALLSAVARFVAYGFCFSWYLAVAWLVVCRARFRCRRCKFASFFFSLVLLHVF